MSLRRSLHPWVRDGELARWWSESQKSFYPVVLFLDDNKQIVTAKFKNAPKAYKLVAYGDLTGNNKSNLQALEDAPAESEVKQAAPSKEPAAPASASSRVDKFVEELKRLHVPPPAGSPLTTITRSRDGNKNVRVLAEEPLYYKVSNKNHAIIYRTESGAYIADLSSVDGTFLDETRLEPLRPMKWTMRQTVSLGNPRLQDELTLAQQREPAQEAPSAAQPQSLQRRASSSAQPLQSRQPAEPPRERQQQQQQQPERPRTRQSSAAAAPEPPSKRLRISEGGQSVQGGSSSSGAPAAQARSRASTAPPCGPARGPQHAAAQAAPQSSGGKVPKCDKCDGPHRTEDCPHFKKSREDHKDAWQNYGKKNPVGMGATSSRHGPRVIPRGREIRQPGDGSCLFHSLHFGLTGGRRDPGGAQVLRRELANFVARNPKTEISGDTLEEWIRWDCNDSVSSYTRRMAVGGWGGGIEMAACSLLKNVNVHVYEKRRGGQFERISCFDCPKTTPKTIHVLYQGGVHYDALIPGH